MLYRILFFSFALQLSIVAQSYIVEDVITGLNRPVAFCFLPNGNIILTQQGGLVKIYNQNNQQISTFWNFTDSCLSVQELGTIGIAIDPDYHVNHKVYIYYTHKIPPALPGDYNHRIFSFVESSNLGTLPKRIFEHFQDGSIGQTHAAGNIYFGKDLKLYFSLGDLGGAQDLGSPRGKILRMNSDGSVPADNPFYDDGDPETGNDDRIWALGLRNPFDFCFSPVNDSLYAGDNGSGPDEIDFIRKGKNYGFPICNGICGNPLFRDPILQIPSGTVPTGIIVYNGSKFPLLYNKLIFAASNSGKLFTCVLGNSPLYDTITSYNEWLTLPVNSGPTALRQGIDSNIYICALGSGKILRLKPGPNGIVNNGLPLGYSLSQNYPNPFNPLTNIKYEMPKTEFVTLKIFNALGMEINTLVNETKQQGSYEVTWDASNFPSGVYFYELSIGEFTERKKMVLVK